MAKPCDKEPNGERLEKHLVLFEELEELLRFSPPANWRRNIEHLFFYFLAENDSFQTSDYRELIGQITRLINLFDTAEGLLSEKRP